MTTQELNAKTVLELRKIAKENGVKLGAGVSKSDIVAKIATAMEQAAAPAAEKAAQPAPQPAVAPAAEPVAPQPAAAPVQPAADKPAQPQYRQAWQNPAPAPRYNAKPAYQAPAYPQRPAWQNRPAAPRTPAPQNDLPRMQTVRPTQYTPRFGPNAGEPTKPQQEDYRSAYRQEPVRPAYQQEQRPAYQQDQRPGYQEPRPAYEPTYHNAGEQQSTQQPAYAVSNQQPMFEPRSTVYQPTRRDSPLYQQDPNMPAPNDLIAPADCDDGAGVLELHPDGYGFLRSRTCVPTSKDIYVSMAQIRRFGLRSGDMIEGKIRPQRDSDKYAAMLYLTSVNGIPADALSNRPVFDELTPVYPTRRINLESASHPLDDMRLVDLIAPIGFGQRALLLCPPDSEKTELLTHFAQVIHENYPDSPVLVLLLDQRPEDVTLLRDAVPGCTVIASTFDQAPETHLRIADLLLEHAQRMVEAGKDVVVLVDNLTRYSKLCTTTAMQQGRGMPGMVIPSSLFKAKRLFGAARSLREGGSLTVIAAMNVETGNKVDDVIVEEFSGTATMELKLDAAIAKAGVHPAISIEKSGTRRSEQLLTPEQAEGLTRARRLLASTPPAQAIPQLLDMMHKAARNEAFLARIGDWAAQMEKSR